MQGLDDHCHMPTLEQLPRDIPVIAQATAAAACRWIHFVAVDTSYVPTCDDPQTARCCSRMQVVAYLLQFTVHTGHT